MYKCTVPVWSVLVLDLFEDRSVQRPRKMGTHSRLRKWPIPAPFIRCRLPKSPDLLAGAEKLECLRVSPDAINSSIEDSGLAVGGEHLCIKEVANSNLFHVSH